jgi:hypothetical protein
VGRRLRRGGHPHLVPGDREVVGLREHPLLRAGRRGGPLEEEIVTSDPQLRRFQYRIVGGAVPVEQHLGTVDVLEDRDGPLVVSSTEVTPDELAGQLGPTIEEGLQGLRGDRLGAATPATLLRVVVNHLVPHVVSGVGFLAPFRTGASERCRVTAAGALRTTRSRYPVSAEVPAAVDAVLAQMEDRARTNAALATETGDHARVAEAASSSAEVSLSGLQQEAVQIERPWGRRRWSRRSRSPSRSSASGRTASGTGSRRCAARRRGVAIPRGGHPADTWAVRAVPFALAVKVQVPLDELRAMICAYPPPTGPSRTPSARCADDPAAPDPGPPHHRLKEDHSCARPGTAP